mmetsp:Transcript_46564/g.124440  ORF Transcript_46564/g.124440 Transcript_46564/m.124440 type:complete len:289 (-) Transcript_46564:143-1009(-)
MKILSKQQLQLQIFQSVVDKVRESMVFLGFVGVTIAITAASLLYLVEPEDNIESYPHACWLTVVSMTTLGYGDVYPVSDWGRLILSFLMVFSAAYMAMPIGVLGNAFSSVWQDRDLILLVERTKRTLAEWGYTVNDLPLLFERYDSDDDGELDLADFFHMMQDLQVNLRDERLVDLFEIFDKDRGGTVDDKEFMHVVFPRAWHAWIHKEQEKELSSDTKQTSPEQADGQPTASSDVLRVFDAPHPSNSVAKAMQGARQPSKTNETEIFRADALVDKSYTQSGVHEVWA